eukprot:gene9658-biopygen12771
MINLDRNSSDLLTFWKSSHPWGFSKECRQFPSSTRGAVPEGRRGRGVQRGAAPEAVRLRGRGVRRAVRRRRVHRRAGEATPLLRHAAGREMSSCGTLRGVRCQAAARCGA